MASDADDAATLVVAVATHADRAAFARLFRLYAPRIKGQLVGRGASAAVADELTQEVMLTVWRKAAQFDPEKGLVGTWLFAITRNCFINHQLRRRWPQPDAAEMGAPPDVPDAQLIAAERQHHLRAALDDLPVEQRETLAGAYYRGRTLRELADEQGVPLGTVKTRVRLAMARLRGLLTGKARHDDDV